MYIVNGATPNELERLNQQINENLFKITRQEIKKFNIHSHENYDMFMFEFMRKIEEEKHNFKLLNCSLFNMDMLFDEKPPAYL